MFSIYEWGVYEVQGRAKPKSNIDAAGQRLPRGSTILGYVTQARRRDKSNPESRLGFVFDRVKLQDGTQVPLYGYIQRVDQYYTRYEISNTIHDECESYDWQGFCQGRLILKPDWYDLDTVTRHVDEGPGVLLTSTKHNIKLGWNIQIQVRLPENLIP